MPVRSAPSAPSDPWNGWMWASVRPGISAAPARSIVSVPASQAARTSSSEPTAMIVPSWIATAVADGRSSSRGRMRAPTIATSAEERAAMRETLPEGGGEPLGSVRKRGGRERVRRRVGHRQRRPEDRIIALQGVQQVPDRLVVRHDERRPRRGRGESVQAAGVASERVEARLAALRRVTDAVRPAPGAIGIARLGLEDAERDVAEVGVEYTDRAGHHLG